MIEDEDLYRKALDQFENAAKQEHRKSQDALDDLAKFMKARGDPQSARASASDLQKDTSKRYGSKKVGSKEIPDTWISNIMDNIGNAIAVGDFMMKGAPESVAMAWFAVKIGLNAVRSDYQKYALFGSGLTVVTEIMILVPHYDRLFHDQRAQGVEPTDIEKLLFDDIVAVYASVLDFCFRVQRNVDAGTWRRLGHGIQDAFGTGVEKFQGKQDNMIALKNKVLERSDGVFKGRVSDQLGDVQQSLQQSIDHVRSFASIANNLAAESAKNMEMILEAIGRPKTRWDELKQAFDKHRKFLEPLADDNMKATRLLESMHPGTTQWFIKSPTFVSWQSESSGFMCLSGGAGSGKSVVVASAYSMRKSTLSEIDAAVCYVGIQVGDLSYSSPAADPLAKVRATIIFQVYRLAIEDESKASMLEECNKIFESPRKSQARQINQHDMLLKEATEEAIANASETIARLAGILKREIVLFIDGVDQLSSKDQDMLFDDLSTISKSGGTSTQRLKIFVGCRSNQAFVTRATTKHVPVIDMQEGAGQDMEAKIRSELLKLSGWSNEEREEAIRRVTAKAGPRFDYITEIAIPFLREPFQRPLSKRLDALPEGIADSYRQALQGMRSNYVSLLKVCLTWTLYSAQPVRVREVMEAFSGVYDESTREAGKTADVGDTSIRASKHELDNLREAGGPFLKFSQNEEDEDIVAVADLDQVRSFCSVITGHAHQASYESICPRCKAEVALAQTLSISEREVHLQLALQCLRSLNHPLFQGRYMLFDEDNEQTSAESTPDVNAEAVKKSSESDANGKHEDKDGSATAGAESDESSDDESGSDGSESDESESEGSNSPHVDRSDKVTDQVAESQLPDRTKQTDGLQKEGETVAAAELVVTEVEANATAPANDDGYDSDGSFHTDVDDEDLGKMTKKTDDASEDDDVYDGSDALRYEIEQWYYHVRQADLLWPDEEKAGSEDWRMLIMELDKFAVGNDDLFFEWQFLLRDSLDEDDTTRLVEDVDALRLASYLGLPYWARHLIEDKGFNPGEFSGHLNALQAAAYTADSKEMLQMLLDQKDASSTGFETGVALEQVELPALHSWLSKDASLETVKVFAAAKVDFGVRSPQSDSTALHYFAQQGTDPAALEVILGTETVDINAANNKGTTPLHILLARSNVPVDLVRAFIRAGADVNRENNESLRPVQAACVWAEPEVVKVLVEGDIEDINDPDDAGHTALHDAARVGSAECLELLLQHGADVNRRDNRGMTAMHYAAWDGRLTAAEMLLRNGADLQAMDKYNRTPFWFSCAGPSEETALLLLDALSPVTTSDKINQEAKSLRTALRLAATRGYTKVVRRLLDMLQASETKLGPILNMQDRKGQATALHRAAWQGHFECVSMLLEGGTDATLENASHKTAMQLANLQWQSFGEPRFEQIVLLLLDADANTARADAELAATAAVNGSVKVLAKLHQLGVSLDCADQYGWTPTTLATRLGKTDAARFLKRQATWSRAGPTRWACNSSSLADLQLTENGLKVKRGQGKMICISTDKPLPAGLDSFYYEVEILTPEEGDWWEFPILAVGFCTLGAHAYDFPGWAPKANFGAGQSWAYHADDGGFWANHTTKRKGRDESYGPGHTVGCGVDLERNVVWFTRDGKRLEFEHTIVSGRLFPILGLEGNVCLRTNFGGEKPFVWCDANAQHA